jgi:hypothetical protein
MPRPRPPHWSNVLQDLKLISPQEAYHLRNGKSVNLSTIQRWSKEGVLVLVEDGEIRVLEVSVR